MIDADYHVHPGYSKDASGSIEDYCKRALKIGIKELCFTPHLDLDPFRAEMDDWVRVKGRIMAMRSDWLSHYLNEVEEMQEKYGPKGLRLKAGVEVDYAPHMENELRRVISDYPFDYVLGAIHCLDHIAISSSKENELYFKGKDLDEVLRHYFSVMEKAVRSGLFDAMAHFDGYRKYGIRHFGEEILLPNRALVEPVLELMAKNSVGLEANASAYRRGQEEPYPGKQILIWAKEAGVHVLACGSDCHLAGDLGKGLERVCSLLKELGFPPTHGFSRRA